jgi:hypothetical protein
MIRRMGMVMKRMVYFLVLALLLTACASAGSPGTGSDSTPNSPAGTGESGTSQVVIDFERQGGITGKPESYKIYSDGTVSLQDGSTRKVSSTQVDEALKAIEAAGFFDLTIPPLKGTCNDCYTYTITVNYNGKTNTITATDNGELPQAFWDAMNEITKLATGA